MGAESSPNYSGCWSRKNTKLRVIVSFILHSGQAAQLIVTLLQNQNLKNNHRTGYNRKCILGAWSLGLYSRAKIKKILLLSTLLGNHSFPEIVISSFECLFVDLCPTCQPWISFCAVSHTYSHELCPETHHQPALSLPILKCQWQWEHLLVKILFTHISLKLFIYNFFSSPHIKATRKSCI